VIAKITRGGYFRGASRYALDERRGLDLDHQPEIIGGNMAGRTSTELTREFEAVRQQRPDIRKPVEHVSLSFARADRPLSNDEMARLADEYLKRRGMTPTASSTWSFGTTTRTTSIATSCSTGSGPIGPWSLSSTASTSATRRPVEPSSGTSAFGLCGASAPASTSERPREPRTGWHAIEAWSRRRISSRP
jgi:hypothetical protein